MDDHLKVGELSRRTGLSIRALHHYHEIGLVVPCVGGNGEHRLYGPAEIARLAHVRSLQALGLSLDEIKSCLDDAGFSPLKTVERHLARLDEHLSRGRRLRDRLEAIAGSLRNEESPSSETFLRTIEMMTMWENYYTDEQKAYLAQRAEEVGEKRIREVQGEWQALFAAFREAKERGDDPASPAVAELSRKAESLIEEFTGGNAGVRTSLTKMYAENPDMPQRWGVEPELWAYMGEARRARGG